MSKHELNICGLGWVYVVTVPITFVFNCTIVVTIVDEIYFHSISKYLFLIYKK